MSPQLQAIINEARELSAAEQLELIAAVSKALRRRYGQLSQDNSFWHPKTLAQLLKEQKSTP